MKLVKEYSVDLTSEDFLLVKIEKLKGKVLDFRVVYLAVIDGRKCEIARYDCHHGCRHKDCFYFQGKDKVKIPLEMGLNDALVYAVGDLKKNFREMRDKYEAKHSGNQET